MKKKDFICMAAIQALPECIKLVAASTAYFGQDNGMKSEERAASMAKEYAEELAKRFEKSIVTYFA